MLARFFLDTDFIELTQWLWDRDQPSIRRDFLPKTGLIVDGIACGFIYFTDSKIAILDGFISNPKASKELRDSALDEITLKLIEYSKKHGSKLIKCDTKVNAIAKRALKHGFTDIGTYQSFCLEL